MKPPSKAFQPKEFLAKAGKGRSIIKCGKSQVIFSQGDPADAVFYIQKGKVKISVVSDRGKEAIVSILGGVNFSAKAAFQARRCASQP